MTKNILLVGLTANVIDHARHELDRADIQLFEGTGIEDVRSVFAQAKIDHVFMGAGIDLETRLQIVRQIFQLSDTTTLHMKDRRSGPQGFLPFVRAVLRGLKDDEL